MRDYPERGMVIDRRPDALGRAMAWFFRPDHAYGMVCLGGQAGDLVRTWRLLRAGGYEGVVLAGTTAGVLLRRAEVGRRGEFERHLAGVVERYGLNGYVIGDAAGGEFVLPHDRWQHAAPSGTVEWVVAWASCVAAEWDFEGVFEFDDRLIPWCDPGRAAARRNRSLPRA